MRKTLIALIAAVPMVAVGAYAFAAQPTAAPGDDLFVKAGSQAAPAEKVEPLKSVNVKSIRLGDDDLKHGERGEHGEMGEGMDD